MFKRMKADYQLAIISLFGVCAIVGVLPFAVYRFLTGAYAVAMLDAAAAVCMAAVLAAAWRTGSTRVPGYVLASIQNTAVMVSALLLGGTGQVWLYPVVFANFFLLPTRLAAAVAIIEIGVLAFYGSDFEGATHIASFVMSALLLVMLAYILAYWTRHQRQQLEMLAAHDALTGLGNRRAMERDLERAILVSNRSGSPVGIAIVDIDHYKQINDCHGHAVGDEVLVAFARRLRASARNVDGVYRMGGDEFLVLFPGATEEDLSIATDGICAAISSEVSGPEGFLTASIGAAARRPGEASQSWLARADDALYRAKAGGRNRACVSVVSERAAHSHQEPVASA